jgi:hypothetical protein
MAVSCASTFDERTRCPETPRSVRTERPLAKTSQRIVSVGADARVRWESDAYDGAYAVRPALYHRKRYGSSACRCGGNLS